MDKTFTLQNSVKLSEEDIIALMNLWNHEYPSSLSYNRITDFENYIKTLLFPEHILIKNENHLIGWAAKFDRETDRWFVIILSRIAQGKGLGSELMNRLKKNECRLNGWVIDHDLEIKTDGSPYQSPLGFYIKNEFIPATDQRLELPNLSAVKVTWTHRI
ncbi:GNAT family N-acetyltransferase [Sphingobacterium sp. HMA12]|uniref:GNAT family N-acetyltransferase n=1 Tax=Sphingobacterium sp. HMA12 TaxID=2050894 RepID=UPI000CEA1E28|nr:GNAT family N-acetyltransferase [Sphingobacterium sp. HMA12]